MISMHSVGKKASITLSLVLTSIMLTACNSSKYIDEKSRGATTVERDVFGDSTHSVAYLNQGWNGKQSEWFYTTTQGSDLMSYWLYLNLEDADSKAGNIELFTSQKNTNLFRYLPQEPTKNNPDGLPVGFVKDIYKGHEYIGLTCAACHTTQINFEGVGMRIDGGPAMADMVLFLSKLENSLKNTLDDASKLQRLAERAGKSIDETKSQVTKDYENIKRYNTINHPEKDGKEIEYGYARLDAFGRIFNRILSHLTPESQDNYNSPNAPVSIPFLWDTPYHDFVQWNGIGDNGGENLKLRLGPLGRNVGEVLGVFANFTLEPGTNQYVSSANKLNLEELERSLQLLWSPTWDDAVKVAGLRPIDNKLAARGKEVYEDYQCAACHQHLDHEERTLPSRRITAQFTSPQFLGTDTTMLENAVSYCGEPGYFTNEDVGMCGDNPNNVPVASALGKAARSVIVKGDPEESLFRRAVSLIKLVTSSTKQNPIKDTKRHIDLEVNNKSNLIGYKGRPLNGIWATAPYLHNGSVSNLEELFMPACVNLKGETPEPSINCRSEKFTVGNREFDQERVGFKQLSKANYPGLFEFDTSLPGNSNLGHEYAAGVTPMIKTEGGKVVRDANGNIVSFTFPAISASDRKALVEYVKSL